MNTNDVVISAASSVAHSAETVASSANEILNGYLLKALEKTGNVIDKAVDIVSEQAPILVHEVLNWYFAYNLILFVFGILAIIILLVIDVKVYKAVQQGLDDFVYVILGAFNAVGMLIIFTTLLNLTWLKIWIAPRLWLIEFTAGLIKGHH